MNPANNNFICAGGYECNCEGAYHHPPNSLQLSANDDQFDACILAQDPDEDFWFQPHPSPTRDEVFKSDIQEFLALSPVTQAGIDLGLNNVNVDDVDAQVQKEIAKELANGDEMMQPFSQDQLQEKNNFFQSTISPSPILLSAVQKASSARFTATKPLYYVAKPSVILPQPTKREINLICAERLPQETDAHPQKKQKITQKNSWNDLGSFFYHLIQDRVQQTEGKVIKKIEGNPLADRAIKQLNHDFGTVHELVDAAWDKFRRGELKYVYGK
jgi:hypothetical protein